MIYWNDFNTKKPGNEGTFLCCEVYDGSLPDVYTAYYDGEDFWYEATGNAFKIFPTHWMAIPELPEPVEKIEDEDEDDPQGCEEEQSWFLGYVD